MLNEQEKKFLLSLARQAIEHYYRTGEFLILDKSELISPALREKRGCFVTLTIGNRLRGCIGHILPTQELYQDVIENAVAAGFQDPRFEPLREAEWKQIKIEISVLTLPRSLFYSSPVDLLAQLRPGIDGVILKKGHQQATFLPQVWEELPDKEDFLGHLCLKAGLGAACWREQGVAVETYQVEAFGK